VRQALLEALIARAGDSSEDARSALDSVPRRASMFAEDRELWLRLRRRQEAGQVLPLALWSDLELGHTSNALAGAPTDPGESGPSSTLVRAHLRARLAAPWVETLRPSLELAVRGSGIADDSAEELSYLEVAARPGVVVGRVRPLLLAYRADRLLLNRHPSRYADGHRLEAELEVGGLTAFAGAGRRTFRDPRRSRDEIDAGLGESIALPGGIPLLVAGAVRHHHADNPAYDLRGATVLAAARVSLGHRTRLRLGLTLSFDDYPHSGGDNGLAVFGSSVRREDLLARLQGELWRRWGPMRLGVRYEYAHRDSTVDSGWGFDYDYNEHRAVVVLRWRAELDPWGPEVVKDAGHVRMDWGFGEPGDEEERIQDLLRQDEEIRRGSACSDGR
jgi:hypothetical protein